MAEDLVASFVAAAVALSAEVVTTTRDDLPEVLRELAGDGARAVGWSAEIGRVLTSEPRTPDGTLPDTWISRGLLAVAATGSIAVAERDPAERRPALLCRRHIVAVPSNRLVPTLQDATKSMDVWIRSHMPYITLVSGPSRTSDIEKVVTLGAHGPAELVVVLVDGWEPDGD